MTSTLHEPTSFKDSGQWFYLAKKFDNYPEVHEYDYIIMYIPQILLFLVLESGFWTGEFLIKVPQV